MLLLPVELIRHLFIRLMKNKSLKFIHSKLLEIQACFILAESSVSIFKEIINFKSPFNN